jgi:hypothetical protein
MMSCPGTTPADDVEHGFARDSPRPISFFQQNFPRLVPVSLLPTWKTTISATSREVMNHRTVVPSVEPRTCNPHRADAACCRCCFGSEREYFKGEFSRYCSRLQFARVQILCQKFVPAQTTAESNNRFWRIDSVRWVRPQLRRNPFLITGSTNSRLISESANRTGEEYTRRDSQSFVKRVKSVW